MAMNEPEPGQRRSHVQRFIDPATLQCPVERSPQVVVLGLEQAKGRSLARTSKIGLSGLRQANEEVGVTISDRADTL